MSGVLIAPNRFAFKCGEVSERLKEHAWKACVRETVPEVRILSSPPFSAQGVLVNSSNNRKPRINGVAGLATSLR